jgi:chromosome segregation ATPase
MMATDSRYDDLVQRLRTAESDIVADRHVSQYAGEQARRGTEAFLALRSEVAALRTDIANTTARVDAPAENVAAINSMLVRHGRAIEVLQQDVREMRNEMAMRQDVAALREEAAARHAELLAAIQAFSSAPPT